MCIQQFPPPFPGFLLKLLLHLLPSLLSELERDFKETFRLLDDDSGDIHILKFGRWMNGTWCDMQASINSWLIFSFRVIYTNTPTRSHKTEAWGNIFYFIKQTCSREKNTLDFNIPQLAGSKVRGNSLATSPKPNKGYDILA